MVIVVILSYSRSDGRTVASRDCGEVDLGVVDAVEDVGEYGGPESQTDLDKLRVAVAGGLDRGEILVADGSAGVRDLAIRRAVSVESIIFPIRRATSIPSWTRSI